MRSSFFKTFSRRRFPSEGKVKNLSRGMIRLPSPPTTETLPPRAIRIGARSEGCTMYDGPPPRIAWYLFSPVAAKHSEPPFLRQTASSRRKYQQRGRWQRLPPTVPRLRI